MNIKILQLDHNIEEAEMLLFRDYDFTKRKYPNKNDLLKLYKVVYEIEDYQSKTMDTSDKSICNDIFTDFNIHRPEDFRGHSLSVSDIIQIDDKYYYVDDIGFAEVN